MAKIIITIEQAEGLQIHCNEKGFAIPLKSTIEVEGNVNDDSDVIPLAVADTVARVYAETLNQGVEAAVKQVVKRFTEKGNK